MFFVNPFCFIFSLLKENVIESVKFTSEISKKNIIINSKLSIGSRKVNETSKNPSETQNFSEIGGFEREFKVLAGQNLEKSLKLILRKRIRIYLLLKQNS